MKKIKDDILSFEKLDKRSLLSTNPWYVESIHANDVWSSIPSSLSKPVVAIVDSGIDFNHTNLKNDIWVNPLEIAGNNKDDDNNGYIDDISGWDFVDSDNSPVDGFYHGTHVAGIIDTVSNSNVKLLPIRFMDNNGSGTSGAAAAAITYAVGLKLRGANIVSINCSFGGSSTNNSMLANAIKTANDNNIVVVLAAGNNGINMDIDPKYPGSLNYSNTLTVGAINPDLSLAGYSNYGKNTVSVASPGTSIYSTLPGNNYGYISGTSMATAVVSGQVGLLKALGNYSATQIKNVIEQGCDIIGELVDKIEWGLVNVLKSWNLLKVMSTEKPIVVVIPSPSPATPISQIAYGITNVSRNMISGWATISNSGTRPVVDIYINNVLRYSVTAKSYRIATKTADGFSVSLNQKFLYSNKKNLIEIRIRNNSGSLVKTAYKGYI